MTYIDYSVSGVLCRDDRFELHSPASTVVIHFHRFEVRPLALRKLGLARYVSEHLVAADTLF